MKSYTEYERFTQEVYQQLSNYHHWGIKNIQHNIKLKGRSGCEHQIDVYWAYEKDGVNHCVAIECHNYISNSIFHLPSYILIVSKNRKCFSF